ncbi:MAG: mercury methylation corrinoid protein HgcA [Chitinivibrionales bacterium]|nr:mercury methylation corrinoid protein HgcA [Chitinivibrionales bacterium]
MTSSPSDCCDPADNSNCGCCCDGVPDQTPKPLPPLNRRGDVLCRLSNKFRMNYVVAPGLYTIGNPAQESPVLVTANYRLTCNHLRKELEGGNIWILVLDTKGINVWCAAGKGSFGTKELINRITVSGLDSVVKHRTIILPQLGAPGVAAHQVKKATGFSVIYGPVQARDIKVYLAGGNTATEAMRTVTFTFKERLVLTFMELLPALKKYLWILLGIVVVMGIQRTGILYKPSIFHSWPIVVVGFWAIIIGTFLAPILLPVIPFRSFALKGALLGAVLLAPFFYLINRAFCGSIILATAVFVFFTTLSSYCALNFTGCTPFTNISGVKKEMRIAVPSYLSACGISAILLVIFKLQELGIL